MYQQRTTCTKQGFWPPLQPKIESYFTAFSLECVVRKMVQVFSFHIDLTLMVGIVTQNGRQNRRKYTKCHFGPQIEGFVDKLF